MSNLIRLRDLPGVREIEAALHVPGRQLLPHFDGLEQRIEDLSRRLFGVAEIDTYLHFEPSDYEYNYNGSSRSLLTAAQDREWEWEEHFDFLRLPWGDERESWTEEGWDVGETNGTRLECLRYFGRPLVCVIDEMLPEAVLSITASNPGSDVHHWENSLAREAERFLAGRGRR